MLLKYQGLFMQLPGLAVRACSLKCFGGEGEGCSGASYVLPGAFVAQMATMPLGPYFQERIGCQASPRRTF